MDPESRESSCAIVMAVGLRYQAKPLVLEEVEALEGRVVEEVCVFAAPSKVSMTRSVEAAIDSRVSWPRRPTYAESLVVREAPRASRQSFAMLSC